jgi:hypothetical protein
LNSIGLDAPRVLKGLLNNQPAVDLTVATNNVDDAEDAESLPSLDCSAEEELLVMLEAALLAILMSLILLDSISSITRPRRSTVYNGRKQGDPLQERPVS